MTPKSSSSFLPQAILFAVLVGPFVVLLEMNSADRIEPSTPLAKSFQGEIEAALSAANGMDVRPVCSMHGNVNFGVSCRVPAGATQNLTAQLLASGWSYADDFAPNNMTLRKSNRRISVSQVHGTNEVSIAMRLVVKP